MLASESIRGPHHHEQQHHHHHRNHHYNESNIYAKQQQVACDAVDSTELARNATNASEFILSHRTEKPSPTIVATLDNDTLFSKNSGVLTTDKNGSPSKKIDFVKFIKMSSVNSEAEGTECDGSMSKRLIVSHPNAETEEFIRICVDEIIKSAVFDGTSRSNKVVEWHSPEEMKELFDFKLNHQAESQEKLFELLKKTIEFSVKTGHPYFINQLYSGVDPYALVGQWLTDALNPSVYTYEVAPVFTLMEEEVLSEMRRIVGFPNSGYGDGIFCPGGSIANGYAISCARYQNSPNSKVSSLYIRFYCDNNKYFTVIVTEATFMLIRGLKSH